MHAYHGVYPMPDAYIAWWLSEDFRSINAYLARVFKLLQSRRPPCLWLLKSPSHLFRLDESARQFLTTMFVMMHRDSLKVMPSVASLHCMLYKERLQPGSIDRKAMGKNLLRFWSRGMRRVLAARAAIGEYRFVSVRNDDVVQRPLEVFERIYAHLNMPLSEDLRHHFIGYSSRNAPGTFGTHRCTLEEYGLSAGESRAVFKDCLERSSP